MLKYFVVVIIALSPTTAAFSASPWLFAYCQGAPLLRCQLSRITEVSKVLTNDRGALFRVQEQSCFKDYRNGRHPKIYDCQSTEIKDAIDVAIYCSSDRPIIAQRRDRDDGWSVAPLSFDDENDFHTVHWDNRLYFLVCHNYDIGEESNIVGFDKLAKRFGYHPIDLSKLDENTKVKTIEEVAAPGRDPPPVLQPANPAAATPLSQAELDAMRARLASLWNVKPGVERPEELFVTIRIRLNPDGRLAAPPQVVSTGSSPRYQAAADAAVSAVVQGQPYTMLRAETYEQWKYMDIDFDPKKMFQNKEAVSNAIADTNVHINNLPSEAGRIAQELVAECKDAGDETGGDLDKTIDVYESGNGKRLAVFDPKRICAYHGNAVCSTDGCDVYIYSEQSPAFWKIALKQTVIGDFTVEEGRGSKPLQVIMNVRGGSPPCNRDRQSTCIFELTWRGTEFAWKRLR